MPEPSISRSPDGIRTRATALRGRRARPLHNGAVLLFQTHTVSQTQTGITSCSAGVPGLEPELPRPERGGLPITPYPTTRPNCTSDEVPSGLTMPPQHTRRRGVVRTEA